MKKKEKKKLKKSIEFQDEPMEWLRLTPSERIAETTKLWQLYRALGGRLDPQPDTQSPFYFQET